MATMPAIPARKGRPLSTPTVKTENVPMPVNSDGSQTV